MNIMQLNQYKWNSEEDFLGRGTFAEVFRAHTEKGNLIVALKISTEAVVDDVESAAGGSSSFRNKYRLEEEYEKGKDLSHTHIIRYWDLEHLVHTDHMNRSRKHAVLIMEYADKGSLEQRLPTGRRLAEDEAWHIAREILSGLTYLHDQMIIHRDLKPANILFKTGKLGKDVVKLTDFGISRDLMAQPAEDAASSTVGVGTSLYMAPEQFLKKTYGLNGTISPRTDFWAWAVILYRMLTGYQPFGREVMDYEALQDEITNAEPDYDGVPERFQAVLKACFRKHAAERPADEQEIIRLVEAGSNYAEPSWVAATFAENPTVKDKPLDPTPIVQPPVQSKNVAQDATRIVHPPSAPKIHGTEIKDQLPGAETQITPKDSTFIKKENLHRKKKSTALWVTGLFLLIALCAAAYMLMVTHNNNIIVSNIAKDMIFVKGGNFEMGSNRDSDWDQPVHPVKVSSFYMGKYEVTQAQWRAIMHGTPPQIQKGDNYPIESVDFDEVETFINKLNEKTGKHYRLPTETEWEYAAKGGNKSRGYIYSGSNDINKVAWFYSNSGDKTHPVGQKEPNELGIYDMSGNVSELCQDNGVEYCASRPAWHNYLGNQPPTINDKIVRGGFCGDNNGACRVGHTTLATGNGFGVGFRLVLTP